MSQIARHDFEHFYTHAMFIYHLLTESEVITGKSQTEALMYGPSDSEVDTSRQLNTLANRLRLLVNWTLPKQVNRLENQLRLLAKRLVSKKTNIPQKKYMDHQFLSLIKWGNISFMYNYGIMSDNDLFYLYL